MASTSFVLVSLLFCAVSIVADPAPIADQQKAVQGLIGRLIGEEYVEKFHLEPIAPTSGGRDVFEIESGPQSAFKLHAVMKRSAQGHFSRRRPNNASRKQRRRHGVGTLLVSQILLLLRSIVGKQRHWRSGEA